MKCLHACMCAMHPFPSQRRKLTLSRSQADALPSLDIQLMLSPLLTSSQPATHPPADAAPLLGSAIGEYLRLRPELRSHGVPGPLHLFSSGHPSQAERATLPKGRLEHGLPRAPLPGRAAAQRELRHASRSPRPAEHPLHRWLQGKVRARLAVLGASQLVPSRRRHLQQRPLHLPATVDGALMPPAATVPLVRRHPRLGF